MRSVGRRRRAPLGLPLASRLGQRRSRSRSVASARRHPGSGSSLARENPPPAVRAPQGSAPLLVVGSLALRPASRGLRSPPPAAFPFARIPARSLLCGGGGPSGPLRLWPSDDGLRFGFAPPLRLRFAPPVGAFRFAAGSLSLVRSGSLRLVRKSSAPNLQSYPYGLGYVGPTVRRNAEEILGAPARFAEVRPLAPPCFAQAPPEKQTAPAAFVGASPFFTAAPPA